MPDDLSDRANHLARSTRRSRSELYSAALREYPVRHAPYEVTDVLDGVVAQADVPDEFTAAAARKRSRRRSGDRPG